MINTVLEEIKVIENVEMQAQYFYATVKFTGVLKGFKSNQNAVEFNELDSMILANGYNLFANENQFLNVITSDGKRYKFEFESHSIYVNKDVGHFEAYASNDLKFENPTQNVHEAFKALQQQFKDAVVEDFLLSVVNHETGLADDCEINADNIKIKLDWDEKF